MKRCPLCNGLSKLFEIKNYKGGNFVVSCTNEACLLVINKGSETEAEALKKWNQRK